MFVQNELKNRYLLCNSNKKKRRFKSNITLQFCVFFCVLNFKMKKYKLFKVKKKEVLCAISNKQAKKYSIIKLANKINFCFKFVLKSMETNFFFL